MEKLYLIDTDGNYREIGILEIIDIKAFKASSRNNWWIGL